MWVAEAAVQQMGGSMTAALAVLTELLPPEDVIYLHGLGSGPGGTKATWLRDNLGAFAVDLDTSDAKMLYDAAEKKGLVVGPDFPGMARAFDTPMRNARKAISDRPQAQLIVASSFGGAVLLKLINEGSWSNPCVFIAQAGVKLTGLSALPAHIPAVLLHGTGDTRVPIEQSRALAANAGPNVQLWELDDEHRMHSILQNGTLTMAILTALNLSRS
jgi:pimeloyl-ACP methyl ester carboxylesterase